MIDYREMLESAAEPEYREFTKKLNPGKDGILGVRIPEIKRIARLIAKDDWEAFLEADPESFEEEMLKALVIATAKMDTGTRIGYTEAFADTIDTWSVCDSFCAAWKVPKKDSEEAYGYFAGLMDSGSEFRMRLSVVFRMDHFLDEDHVDDILDDIVSYDHEGYYYRMGAAWALSFCYIRFPELTQEALKSEDLDDWVCNKAVQKVCESYRVTEEGKAAARALKRKMRMV